MPIPGKSDAEIFVWIKMPRPLWLKIKGNAKTRGVTTSAYLNSITMLDPSVIASLLREKVL